MLRENYVPFDTPTCASKVGSPMRAGVPCPHTLRQLLKMDARVPEVLFT
jgi:hypothetical protein